jgi:hypothetical protein
LLKQKSGELTSLAVQTTLRNAWGARNGGLHFEIKKEKERQTVRNAPIGVRICLRVDHTEVWIKKMTAAHLFVRLFVICLLFALFVCCSLFAVRF